MFLTISVTSWATVGRRATCGITVTLGCSQSGLCRRQRLGPQRVQRRIGQLPGIEHGDQVRVHHMLAAPDIHQHGAARHHGEGARAEDPLGFRRQRQQAHRDIGLVEERLELIGPMKNRDLFGLPWRADPGGDLEAERLQHQRGRLGHQSEAEKADAPLLRPEDRCPAPFPVRLRRLIGRHLAMETQHMHDDILGHHRIAARRLHLAQRDLRQFGMLDDVIHPGRPAEHRLQIRKSRQPVEIRMHECEVFDLRHIARIGPDANRQVGHLLPERFAPRRRIADTLVQLDEKQRHTSSKDTCS